MIRSRCQPLKLMKLVALVFAIAALPACGSLFFVPDTRLVLTPKQLNLRYQDVQIPTADGVLLHGWLLKGKSPVRGTVLFLHGNAQNISYHIASVRWLPAHHYNVLLYDYRGFGQSGGRSTLDNAVGDFRAVVKAVDRMLPKNERKYAVFGQSLGASLAVAALAESPPAQSVQALVIDSGFSGFRRIAREKMSEIPVTRAFSGLLQYLFPATPDLTADIARIRGVPVLIIHGEKDNIVPWSHARRLFEHANTPKALIIQPEAGHIQALASRSVRRRMLRFLNRAFASAPEDSNRVGRDGYDEPIARKTTAPAGQVHGAPALP